MDGERDAGGVGSPRRRRERRVPSRAEVTMAAIVNLAMTDEFPDIGQNAAAGEEAPRMRLCPFALLNSSRNAGILMRFGPLKLMVQCGDGSTPQAHGFNDCVHDFSSESAGADAIVRHWDIDAVCIDEIGVISMRRQLDSARHGFQRLRARGMKPAKEMDESASDGVGHDVFPRPADCGMPVDVASQEKAGCMVRHRGACLGAGVGCRRLRHGVDDDV